jgi:methanogenic corrinoid protein MtbC1
MADAHGETAPLSRALAHSPYFSVTEPIVDVAETPALDDPYLSLARTIEREVIPRLLLKNRLKRQARKPVRTDHITSPGVKAFCAVILNEDFDRACGCVTAELASGRTLDTILLDLFAPTARYLGELWESDDRTFVEVTIALGKLQQLLREFSISYTMAPDPKKLGFRALLATVPTNIHVFGILLVEELFRRSGWNVFTMPAPSRADLLDTIARDWFAVVGLSVSCDDSADDLAALIADLRKASLNRSILVIVGGNYFSENPEQAVILGADLMGADAQQSIEQSQDFLRSIGR